MTAGERGLSAHGPHFDALVETAGGSPCERILDEIASVDRARDGAGRDGGAVLTANFREKGRFWPT